LIELFGTDLDQPGIAVAIGNIPQKVVKAENDRLVIQVAAKSGPITLMRQQATRKSKAQSVPFASSKTTFTALKPDKMFGQPRKHADNGLVGLVYKIDPGTKEVPDFSKFGQPDAVIAVDNLDIASGTSKQGLGTIKENFAIHFKGSLNVVDGGDYNLCLGAGDGAQLYLEEGLVLDNDGSHDTEEVCDDVFIEAGEYALDLLYYQGTGELGLQLSWAKADGNKVAVPAEVFFPPEDRVNLVVP
jgi:hypothetical protein